MISNTNIKYENTCHDPLALCSTSNKDKFWLDDPKELYENGNYLLFIPKYEMTKNQQSNAISRLCFYMILLILIFGKGEIFLFIPITILILVILFNKVNMFDKFGGMKELRKIFSIREEDKVKNEETYTLDTNKTYPTYQERIDAENAEKPYTLKTGFYDSNGTLIVGGDNNENPSTKTNNASTNYTADELKDYKKNTCKKPTPDNPLMNLQATDWGNINIPEACNADDDDIKDDIAVNFNHDLFRDVDEVFDKANSQRQFYTMPNTSIPNNQTEFAQWLYRKPKGTLCKDEDMSKCIHFYDDVRYRIR